MRFYKRFILAVLVVFPLELLDSYFFGVTLTPLGMLRQLVILVVACSITIIYKGTKNG